MGERPNNTAPQTAGALVTGTAAAADDRERRNRPNVHSANRR